MIDLIPGGVVGGCLIGAGWAAWRFWRTLDPDYFGLALGLLLFAASFATAVALLDLVFAPEGAG